MNLVITNDGSHTLYKPELNEHYHSTFGAMTESQHVFIDAGLSAIAADKKQAVVFEAGFGTGLNALLSCIYALNNDISLMYYAIERYPVEPAVTNQLNYPSYLKEQPDSNMLFRSVHSAPWNVTTVIHEKFSIHKIHEDITAFVPAFSCDVVYYDAFAPEKQPEMWTEEIFLKIFNMMNAGGILTTYCVKGLVKSMLRKAGFRIEKLPGPPGKREILRAYK